MGETGEGSTRRVIARSETTKQSHTSYNMLSFRSHMYKFECLNRYKYYFALQGQYNILYVNNNTVYTGACFMKNEYTAVVKQDGEWWIGWIEEVPGVNCQEKTHDELIETLRITLKEALELNKEDAISAAGDGYREIPIAL